MVLPITLSVFESRQSAETPTCARGSQTGHVATLESGATCFYREDTPDPTPQALIFSTSHVRGHSVPGRGQVIRYG